MTVDDLENVLYKIVRSFFVKTESVLNVMSRMNILQKLYSKYKMSNMWQYPSRYSYAYGPICNKLQNKELQQLTAGSLMQTI
jgi:hypothetical protein